MSAEQTFPVTQERLDFSRSLRKAGVIDKAFCQLVLEDPEIADSFNSYSESELPRIAEYGSFMASLALTLASRASNWDKVKEIGLIPALKIPNWEIAEEANNYLDLAKQAIEGIHNKSRIQEIAQKDAGLNLQLERDRSDFLMLIAQMTGNPVALEMAIRKMDQVIAKAQVNPVVQTTLRFEKARLNFSNGLIPFNDLKEAYREAQTEAQNAQDWQTSADLALSYLQDSQSILRPIETAKTIADNIRTVTKDSNVSYDLAQERADRILPKHRKIFWERNQDQRISPEAQIAFQDELQTIFEAPKVDAKAKPVEIPVKTQVVVKQPEKPEEILKKEIPVKQAELRVDPKKISLAVTKADSTTLEAGATIQIKATLPNELVRIFDIAATFAKPEYKDKSGGLIYEKSY